MTTALKLECEVHFRKRAKGRKEMHDGATPQSPTVEPGRVPRIARLVALAIHFDDLVRTGVVSDYAELARLGQVTRARISQIVNLLQLAPDIQEAILFLPRIQQGRDALHLRQLQPIAANMNWRTQRRMWRDLIGIATVVNAKSTC